MGRAIAGPIKKGLFLPGRKTIKSTIDGVAVVFVITTRNDIIHDSCLSNAHRRADLYALECMTFNFTRQQNWPDLT